MHIRHIIIPNAAGFPMVSAGSVILKKCPDKQEDVVTTIIFPGMQKKEISCLIIIRCWHPFELIIVSKQSIQDSVSEMFSSIAQKILMLDGYHSQMSFMRATPSFELINCGIMLQLVFHPPQNASLAFVDIGNTT
jgi:hypothetical protein